MQMKSKSDHVWLLWWLFHILTIQVMRLEARRSGALFLCGLFGELKHLPDAVKLSVWVCWPHTGNHI